MIYPYNAILFSHKKEWSTNTWYNIDEPWKYHAHKKPHIVWHLYEKSRTGKLIVTKTSVIAKGWGKGGMESNCCWVWIGMDEASFWSDEMFWNQWWWVHNHVNTLKTADMYTLLKGESFYFSYISIKSST